MPRKKKSEVKNDKDLSNLRYLVETRRARPANSRVREIKNGNTSNSPSPEILCPDNGVCATVKENSRKRKIESLDQSQINEIENSDIKKRIISSNFVKRNLDSNNNEIFESTGAKTMELDCGSTCISDTKEQNVNRCKEELKETLAKDSTCGLTTKLENDNGSSNFKENIKNTESELETANENQNKDYCDNEHKKRKKKKQHKTINNRNEDQTLKSDYENTEIDLKEAVHSTTNETDMKGELKSGNKFKNVKIYEEERKEKLTNINTNNKSMIDLENHNYTTEIKNDKYDQNDLSFTSKKLKNKKRKKKKHKADRTDKGVLNITDDNNNKNIHKKRKQKKKHINTRSDETEDLTLETDSINIEMELRENNNITNESDIVEENISHKIISNKKDNNINRNDEEKNEHVTKTDSASKLIIDWENENSNSDFKEDMKKNGLHKNRKKKKKHKKGSDKIKNETPESGKRDDDDKDIDGFLVSESVKDTSKFMFTLSPSEWDTMKPEVKNYSNGRKVMRLNKNWTEIFADKTNEVFKGCVLAFRSHHVKAPKSRKIFGPYMVATATCKGLYCKGNFEFKIENDPCCGSDIDIVVNCKVNGCINHNEEEINRRHLSGLKREKAAEDIQNSSSLKAYYDNILKSDIEQMKQGNFTTCPNNDVLRKVVSEVLKKENMHNNIMAEIQILKESYEKENDPYIREIGLDPFTVILISDKQIQFLKHLSNENNLNLYFDATGSVISNIPGQKKPYLYSLVCKPNPGLPAVSVADMLSTQHTIPKIELFLSTLKRQMNMTGSKIKIEKIETDYSFALLQASLHTFSNSNLKEYLVQSYKIIKGETIPGKFVVHHLCATHMIKDFSRQFKKYKPNSSKVLRTFMFQCFAALQNSTTLAESVNTYEDVCTVCLNKYFTPDVSAAKDRLFRQFRKSDDFEQINDEEINAYLHNPEEDNLEGKTIKNASPFTDIFDQIKSKIELQISDDTRFAVMEENTLHCPEVIDCLNEKFLPIICLWSGFMLNLKKENTSYEITRDSNSPVENYFKVIKNDIGLKKRCRPAKFIVSVKQFIYAKLIEIELPGCRKKSTSRGKRRDIDLELNEEKWQKGSKSKKKRLYHLTPNKRDVLKETSTDTSKCLPVVMKWGGTHNGSHLENTCTIDNALTILHMKFLENKQFSKNISEQGDILFKTLLTIFKLMSEENFEEAKFVWLTHMNIPVGRSTNLYGDELDFFVQFFDRQWKTSTTSICDNANCNHSFIESRNINGITIR